MSEEYERLRAAALDPVGSVRQGLGLGVFLVKGMIGWMDALPALRPPMPSLGTSLVAAGGIRPATRPELVQALANMVLSTLGGL